MFTLNIHNVVAAKISAYAGQSNDKTLAWITLNLRTEESLGSAAISVFMDYSLAKRIADAVTAAVAEHVNALDIAEKIAAEEKREAAAANSQFGVGA